ncbi:MAG: single-stranded DNA-binding protein, partial [Acidobacteriota bacterium]|nr:single-stranded DNA-binding protein [Acidobacteriota bacterium]
QHLLPRMIRGLTGGSVACQVDSDNFHEVRAEQLRVMAQDAAAEVRRSRRMQTLEPMSPDERRIVHLTLADDPAVETESHGTGLFKRVTVRPAHRPSRGSDDYRR